MEGSTNFQPQCLERFCLVWSRLHYCSEQGPKISGLHIIGVRKIWNIQWNIRISSSATFVPN
ncbi:unnamed protein product [Moneuplotes crassus]|uniref:Uncharacterized protein n=1 Tax=Euplotes crassus TaxID=5936 RepID=A0AAD1XLR6_EUPCR|nr:unnamed protein product [Moneuplotes crassus]